MGEAWIVTVFSRLACMRISLCFILMSEGLVKLMWTGLPPGVNGVQLGGVLRPGDSTDNLREELDEESD